MKKKHHIVQDDRAIVKGRDQMISRMPARMEGSVKNAGIREKKKDPKPRA